MLISTCTKEYKTGLSSNQIGPGQRSTISYPRIEPVGVCFKCNEKNTTFPPSHVLLTCKVKSQHLFWSIYLDLPHNANASKNRTTYKNTQYQPHKTNWSKQTFRGVSAWTNYIGQGNLLYKLQHGHNRLYKLWHETHCTMSIGQVLHHGQQHVLQMPVHLIADPNSS